MKWLYTWRIPILATLGFLVVLAVAGVTGYMSWGHIVDVGRKVGEPSADLLPVAVDGMMVAGAILAYIDRLRGMAPRFWSYVCLWLGSALTLTFNVLSAVDRGIPAMLLAVVPAVTFLASVEAVFHPSRRPLEAVRGFLRRRSVIHDTATPEPAPVQPAVAPVTPSPVKAPRGRRSAPRTSGKVPTGVKPSKQAPKPAKVAVPEPVPAVTGDDVADVVTVVYAHDVSTAPEKVSTS